MKNVVIWILLFSSVSCAKLGMGDKDKDQEPAEVNQVSYREAQDNIGRWWFEFSNGRIKCSGVIGDRYATCSRVNQ